MQHLHCSAAVIGLTMGQFGLLSFSISGTVLDIVRLCLHSADKLSLHQRTCEYILLQLVTGAVLNWSKGALL